MVRVARWPWHLLDPPAKDAGRGPERGAALCSCQPRSWGEAEQAPGGCGS